jgi:hypothetical protein
MMMRQASRLITPGTSAPSAWARSQVHEAVPSGEKPKLGPTKGTIAAHADIKSARKPPRIKLSGALPGKVDRAGALSESIDDETLLLAAGALRGDAGSSVGDAGSSVGVSMDTSLAVSRS